MFELKNSDFYIINNLVLELKNEILWINSVLNRKQGRVFVDNINDPKTAIIWHKSRDGIIVGKYNEIILENLKLLLNNEFEENQNQFALFIVDKDWQKIIDNYIVTNKNINKYHRKAFRLDLKEFDNIKKILNEQLNVTDFRKINVYNYSDLKFKYMPDRYWNCINEFLSNGIGFSIFKDNKHIAIAFSGSLENNKCDISVETIEGYRGKGYATLVCAKLIEYCFDNNIEPVWECRDDNVSSAQLANKLGFTHIRNIAYYIKDE